MPFSEYETETGKLVQHIKILRRQGDFQTNHKVSSRNMSRNSTVSGFYKGKIVTFKNQNLSASAIVKEKKLKYLQV